MWRIHGALGLALATTACAAGGNADGGFFDASLTGDATASGDAAGDDANDGEGGDASPDGPSDAAPEAAPCVAAALVGAIGGYVPVVRQSVCSPAQITAWLSACGGGFVQPPSSACVAWIAANSPCGDCIQPAGDASTGVALYGAGGQVVLNVGGCVDLFDHDASCGGPFDRAALCELAACASPACLAASTSLRLACAATAQTGACAAYSASAGACLADETDGGPLAEGGACLTPVGIATAICGM